MESFKFTLNGSTLRRESMDGKEYLVAPMAMLTEGVHAGSNGPLYYPKTELAKTPMVWNMKPLVVYHPTANGQGVSACSPEVIETRGVGIVMNSYFDGKLRAEAWIDEPKLKKVDNRVLEALNKGQMVEISTGLFTDNEPTQGEWNGEKYVAIARNYRPDHLAILPDKKGACSIADGAGLLQLNDASIDMLGNDADMSTDAAAQEALLTYNRDWPQEKRDKLAAADFAGPNQTFPIKTQADVKAAASLAHHAKDPAAVKRRIKAIAKRKGLKLPKAWQNEDGNATTNASHADIRKALQQAVTQRAKAGQDAKNRPYNYVRDVYDKFFIYGSEPGMGASVGPYDSDGGGCQYFYQEYEISGAPADPDKKTWPIIKLKGVPKEVKQVTTWQDLQGNIVANHEVQNQRSAIRQKYIDELRMNGFDTAKELEMFSRIPLERLAFLVQNTWQMAMNVGNSLTQNVWTAAARQAARIAKQHGFKHALSSNNPTQHHFENNRHTLSIGSNGIWTHTHNGKELGHGSLASMSKHLKSFASLTRKRIDVGIPGPTRNAGAVGGANFAAPSPAPASTVGGGTEPSTAPPGGSPTPGEKLFGQRKARTPKRKNKKKPLNAIMAPNGTNKY